MKKARKLSGSAPDPVGDLTALPQIPSWWKGLVAKNPSPVLYPIRPRLQTPQHS